MKNRLIELFSTFTLTQKQLEPLTEKDAHEQLADYLLANGVFAPNVKIGDTVYIPWEWAGQQGIAVTSVEEIRFYGSQYGLQMHYLFFVGVYSDDADYNEEYGGWKPEDSIGKTVFLTREAAEAALEARNAKT